MGDSQKYGVMSFEEADELKREVSVLTSRIDATKRKLAIESKIRDASTSLNRLNSSSRDSLTDGPGNSNSRRHRRSIMSRGSANDLLSKTDEELAASTKKCEELAQELWRLEKRLQEAQKQLLEHTAGVLQMTHKGFLEKEGPLQSKTEVNGYSNGGHGSRWLDVNGDFDDHSFYESLDAILEPHDTRADGQAAAAFEQQTQSILEIERKIWDLNRRLRDSIAQVSSGRKEIAPPPAPNASDQGSVDSALRSQLTYLENGLDTMQRSQIDTLQGYKQSVYAAEERLEDLNTQLRGIIIRSSDGPSSQYPLPPEVSGKSPEEQIAFLESGLDALEQAVQRLQDYRHEMSSRSLAHEEKVNNYEGTVQDLWQNLVNHEEGLRNQTQENPTTPAPKEIFSLGAFTTKVQSLHKRSAHLQEQKDILGRQIQQQRDLNSKSDTEKDARMTELNAELEGVRNDLQIAIKGHEVESTSLRAQVDANQEAKNQILSELQNKNDELSNLEVRLQVLLADQEDQAGKTRSLEESVQAKSAEAEKARAEMQDFEGEMVRLQTELTVARAELDGAYGTRAQRAAEVASHPALLQEISELKERNTALEAVGSNSSGLNHRVQTLQKELSETIGEYEIMTKASIEYEKERENLENTIDSLRDRCENLEAQLSDERVNGLGTKSPGRPGSRDSVSSSSTSTSVLKNEFKKMMKETRQENMKALRVGGTYFRAAMSIHMPIY